MFEEHQGLQSLMGSGEDMWNTDSFFIYPPKSQMEGV